MRDVSAPGVYRFVCPDGRSYVGSRADIRKRGRGEKIGKSTRLREALAQHPRKAWIFEVLEVLPPGCSKSERLEAEQRHIDRLRSWDPAHGFNTNPAGYNLDGYLREPQLAAELDKDTRTLQRWRKLGIGPPFVMFGQVSIYNIELARQWLAAGGMAAPPSHKRTRS